jgi:hypothetical protein
MSPKLTSALMGAGALLCLLATTTGSQALTCTRGSYTTSACRNALASQTDMASQLVDCLNQMQDEYSGVNGTAGAGKNFDKKKRECLNLARSISTHVSVDSATGDDDRKPTPDLDSAAAAVIGWANKK